MMTRFHRTTMRFMLMAALCLTSGCRKHTPPSANLFPTSSEVAGWSREPEIRTFAPARLSDYIDGDAEKYLRAGVKSACTADYQYKDKTQVVVDVYTMNSSEGAKSIFDSEPAMDAQTPTLGDASRLYSQSLIFRKGPFLVRMVAYQESPQLLQAMLELGHAIETKLPG